MNSTPTTPATPNRDLFFRLADRLQLDACVQAVAEEGKSVILHSVNAGMLDHYGQLLVQRLRQRLPQTPTEVFFPTHTEALIQTFNAMLEDVSVDDATQAGGPSAPSKLWVVHDASALPDHELKLMARLLQHLPGARVSAVLMLHGQAEVLRNLDPQGRRLMRWDIEPPTQEQIDQLVQEARQQGREFATLELVARLGAPAPTPAAAANTPPAAKPGAAAPAAPTGTEATAPTAAKASRMRRLAPALAAAAGLLLLSVGVAAWLHPDAVRQLMPKDKPATAAAPISAASEAPPAAPADASAPSAPAAEASASTGPASEAPVSAAPVAPATVAVPAVPTTTGTPAATVATSSPAKTPEPAPAPSKNWVTELPEPAQRGLSWLRQLDKDTWVIEHGRHPSIQAARKQLGGDKLLTNARIVPVVRQGQDTAEFLLVTGPFRSQDRARNFSARNELPPSTKVHATNTLLAMTPSGNEAARP